MVSSFTLPPFLCLLYILNVPQGKSIEVREEQISPNYWIRQTGHHASASHYGRVQMLALSRDAMKEAYGRSHIAQFLDACGTFSG